MQIGIANGIPLNDVITGDDLVPAYDQSTGTEGYVNLTTAVQKAFSGDVAGTANGVLYLNGSKVATSSSALTFDGTNLGVVNSAPTITVFETASGNNNRLIISQSGITTSYNSTYSSGDAAQAWKIANTEGMRLTSTGLGIGTSSPTTRLQLTKANTTTGLGNGGLLTLENTDGGAFDQRAEILFKNVGQVTSAISSSYTAFAAGPQYAGALIFATKGEADSAIVERARIDSSGNLLIGQTAIGFANSNSEAIYGGQVVISHVSSASSGAAYAQFGYAGGAIGSITQNGTTAVSYNTSSDYRLKDITGPVTNSGAYIDSLNPVEGTWKADGSTFVGLIAHEVQEVSRTSIATGVKDGEEMQAMDYSSAELIANLIAEVKSLRARVAALEA